MRKTPKKKKTGKEQIKEAVKELKVTAEKLKGVTCTIVDEGFSDIICPGVYCADALIRIIAYSLDKK